MQKKVLSMLLAVFMTASLLTGCGGKDVGADVTPATDPSRPSGETGSASQAAELVLPEGVRPNGQIDEFTDDEYAFYSTLIFQAFQTLDIDTLTVYADKEEDIACLQLIKSDSQMQDFWAKTVGQWVYFSTDHLLLLKYPSYIEAKWYTDLWQSGAEAPNGYNSAWSFEETLEIYDKYYEAAPYELIDIEPSRIGDFFKLSAEDGYVKCNLSRILQSMDHATSLDALCDLDTASFHPALLIMGSCVFLGDYDRIERTVIPKYKEYFTGDVDTIAQVAREYAPTEEGDIDFYFRYIETYFESEEYHDIMQTYLDENVEILQNGGSLLCFMPLIVGQEYPADDITEETKAALDNYHIVTLGNAGGTLSALIIQPVQKMKYLGLITE